MATPRPRLRLMRPLGFLPLLGALLIAAALLVSPASPVHGAIVDPQPAPPKAPTAVPPTPTPAPFTVAGRWTGTITLTDAKVTEDIEIPDPLGKDPPQKITKEECEREIEKNKGKAQDLEMEFKPSSPAGGTVVVGSGEKPQSIPYRLSGDQVSASISEEDALLSMEGQIVARETEFVMSGSYVLKLGTALTVNSVWTVTRPRQPNELPPVLPTATPAPTATPRPSATPAPTATPRPERTQAPTPPPTTAPTTGPTSAPTRAPTSGPTPGRTATPSPARTPGPKGKDPLGPTPPGLGGVGKVPGPNGLTEAAAGGIIPGLVGALGGLLAGLGGKPSAPAAPPPPESPPRDGGGPSGPSGRKPEEGEKGEKREGGPSGTDAEKARRKAEIRQAGERAQAEAAAAANTTGAIAGEAMESAHKEITDLAGKVADFGSWLWGKTKETAKDAADAAKEVAANPQILTDTLKASAQTVANGFSKAASAAASAANSMWQAAKAAWNDPKAALDAAATAIKSGLGSAWETGGKALTSIKEFLSDPQKMWETVKEATGISNFANSLDPNRSLAERLGQVGLGVAKLYITIQTAGAAAGAMKGGATTVMEVLGGRAAAGRTAAGVTEAAAGRTAGAAITRGGVQMEGAASEGLLTKGAKGLADAPGVRPDLRGIPKGQLDTIGEIAQKRGVEIAVRPTTADAMPWLESGRAIPKPAGMYNKSINMVDEMLGAPAGRRGLVGHFEPKLPPMPQDPKLRAEVLDRYLERMKEWRTYKDKIEHLRSTGKIRVIDGVIHDAATGKPFVSDIDLGGVFKNGKPVPEDVGRWITQEIRKKCPGVVHDDINSWYPVGAKQKGIMSGIMGGHAPGGKPLVVVSPKGVGAGFFNK